MDAKQLHSLISTGENRSTDFKRELNLESADEKAELIKDLVSIANSVSDKGYLIIGVDNTSESIGIEKLEEERIQQIAHTYIYPSIDIHCHLVYLEENLIGVIEIRPTEKPHRVIKSIGRLLMNDVFIRHGSTVAKADPDELFRMREKEPEIQQEIKTLAQAAERHLEIGNIKQAIQKYSKAIKLMPTAELLLARGKTHEYFFEPDETYMNGYVSDEIAKESLKDFSDAYKLADSDELRRIIRLERIKLYSISNVDDDEVWDNDLSWAFENTYSTEYANVLFCVVRRMLFKDEKWNDKKPIEYMNTAINLGFDKTEGYYLRAIIHYRNQNFGFALADINKGIEKNGDKLTPLLKDCLHLRSDILLAVGCFEDAFRDLSQASSITIPNDMAHYPPVGFGDLEKTILQEMAILWKFGSPVKRKIYKEIVTLLLLDDGAPKYMRAKNGKLSEFGRGTHVHKEVPYIVSILKEIVGREIWQTAQEGHIYEINVELKPDLK